MTSITDSLAPTDPAGGRLVLAHPATFNTAAGLVLAAILLALGLAVFVAPWGNLAYHFEEGGKLTILSSALLAMAGALAFVVAYIRGRSSKLGLAFWLLTGLGLSFLSLDEVLEFHETLGVMISDSSIGWPAWFRNWNDVLVIAYGGAALMVLWLFRLEITRCPTFLQCLAVGFLFYALHTGIDSLVSNDHGAMKDIPEEAAKILCGAFLFLGVAGFLMAQIDDILDRHDGSGERHISL